MNTELEEFSGFKEEGRAGLLFAIRGNDEYISAEDAVSGEKYFCPGCGCKMHVATSKCGKRYFARNAGEQHTNGKCISYERGRKHTFDSLDPKRFICSLCRVIPKKDVKVGTGSHDVGDGDSKTLDGDETKLLPFTTLKQIANEMDFFDVGKVSDFLLSFRNAENVVKGKGFNLGARIVCCRYAAYKGESNALLFNLFCKRYGATVLTVRFSLLFTSKKEFLAYREKFGMLREMENGLTRFVKHHEVQDVLLACDNWEFVFFPQCKGNCGKKRVRKMHWNVPGYLHKFKAAFSLSCR